MTPEEAEESLNQLLRQFLHEIVTDELPQRMAEAAQQWAIQHLDELPESVQRYVFG
jgi:hypothetical protein